MKRYANALFAAGLIAATTVLPTAIPASAASCSRDSHCYGLVRWPVYSINGIQETLYVSCIYTPSTAGNFVTAEMWISTDGSGGGGYWVEEGVAYGSPRGNSEYFYWADRRPGGGYHEHDLPGEVFTYTNFTDKITWAGSNSWNVYRNGSHIGTSTKNPKPAKLADTGEEATSSSASELASMSGLKWLSTHNAWHSGWNTASYHPYFINNSPMHAAWYNKYTSIYTKNNCQKSSSDARNGEQNAFLTAADVSSGVKATAISMASQNGVSTPQDVEYTTVSRNLATTLVGGDSVGGDQPVYLVQMRGNFIGNSAKVPEGQSKPTGTVMTLTIDPASGDILDWGISNKASDLAAINGSLAVKTVG